MKMKKQPIAVLTALACLLSLAGCNDSTTNGLEDLSSSMLAAENSIREESQTQSQASADSFDTAEAVKLSNADQDTEWGSDAVTLAFSGTDVAPSAQDGLRIENGSVTITKGGTYVLSGSLDDGRVIVDLEDKQEKVHIVLNGVSLTSKTSSPLTVLQADKTVITLADGTENVLCDAAEYTDYDVDTDESAFPNACLASKDDLTINGSGSLTVSGSSTNGISCSDDLKIVGGTLNVTAAGHGIRGKDSVLIHEGSVTVKADGDGIKSSTSDTEGKGSIIIEAGKVNVTAAQDGIDAAAELNIIGGELVIEAGGGAENGKQHSDGMFGGGFDGGFGGGFSGRGGNGGGFSGRGGNGGRRQAEETEQTAFRTVQTAAADSSAEKSTSTSTKGIKSGAAMKISGGSVQINSADDAVHSNGTLEITGNAHLALASGDDGLHADTALNIAGNAEVAISKAYEGIESAEILISGGSTRVMATDDGLNASGAELTDEQKSSGRGGFMSNSTGTLTITGGYLFVNADGDGLDSNGDINMNGGVVVVCGPTNSGNGPLDSGDNGNKISVTGGTLMAVGSTGMMETPEENFVQSKQLNAEAGTLITVTDEDGNVLGALRTPKKAEGIVFSADARSNYKIYTGGEYSGTLNDDGFSSGGTCSGGKEIEGSTEKLNGFGNFGGGQRPGDMTPPSGFNFSDGAGLPDGFTPPDGSDLPEGFTPPENFDLPEGFSFPGGSGQPGGFGGFGGQGRQGGNTNETSRTDRGGFGRNDNALTGGNVVRES